MRSFAPASALLAALFVPVVVATAAPLTGVLAQAAPSTSASGSASAAPTGDDARAQALSHFNKGVELMQSDSYDAAYAEFSASLALLPTKNARKNAAQCLLALKRYDEALAMYQLLLQEFSAKLSPVETDNVKKAIEDLHALTGTIVIKSNVDGATVVIDGRDRGKTPLPGPIIVSAGTRVVKVSREGYLPFETSRLVAGKATETIDANLDALARAGRLSITEESGKVLDVYIDGAKVGVTPYEGQQPPGAHAVLLKGEGKLGTQPTAATVVVDQTVVLRLRAEVLAGEARIEPEPAGATIVLDGVPVGQGTWEGALRVGSHKVDVSAEGYFGATRTFDATDGKKVELKVALDRDDASPFWAKGRTFPVSIALFGGLGFGKSLGGDYESKCGDGCYAHSAPLMFFGGARGAYEVARGLAIELDLGYAYVKSEVSRKTQFQGEIAAVPVDVTDTVRFSGPFIGVGASYVFLRRPFVLSGAVVGGIILARVREARTGFATVDDAPTQRPLAQVAIDPITKAVPFFVPEVRLAIPLTEQISLGLGLGALIAVSDTHPVIKQPPVSSDADRDSAGRKRNPFYQGNPVGQLPKGSPESATGTFVLPEASIFAKMAF